MISRAGNKAATRHTTAPLSNNGLRDRMANTITRLPQPYQQILTLYYIEMKSSDEISRILGIPSSQVHHLLYKAKTRLVCSWEKKQYN